MAMKLKHTYLLLGMKAMTNLVSILKRREITLLTKVCIIKARAFSVVIYGCESCLKIKLSTEQSMLLNYCAGEDS